MNKKEEENLTKSSIERLLEQNKTDTLRPDYSEEEQNYLGALQNKLTRARDARDDNHIEFDGLTYVDYYSANERYANTTIEPVKNKGMKDFKSGTLRTKLNAYLSTIINLNLTGEIQSFNKDSLPLKSLGRAMEDIIFRLDQNNNDEEFKQLRQYELLKQGTVFIELNWEEKYSIQKKLTKGGLGKLKSEWTTKFKKECETISKNIISGLSVYLGNIRQYDINKQPFIFTIETIDYDSAKQLYGTWDRWKYVTTNKQSFSGDSGLGSPWKLIQDDETIDKVEVIKYQSLKDNEYQIILNGIPMLPQGFPLPWGYNRYSIVQQNLEPIRHNFAYGKSFIFNNKNLIQVLDELLKLSVLKTHKSFQPPRINQSGKRITPDMFLPSKVINGIRKGEIVPLDDYEAQGVTNAEFAMVNYITTLINNNTVSQTFTGAQEGGDTTATQIIEIQRQAKIMMGITILSCTLLEKKITENELDIILEKWFNPIDKEVDEVRGILKNKYRQVTRERNIGNKGKGLSIVTASDDTIPKESVYDAEENLTKRYGTPVRISIINRKELEQRKVCFYVTVAAKDKQTSEMQKIMLKDMVQTFMAFGLPVNIDYVAELFGDAYEIDSDKIFTKTQQVPQVGEEEGAELAQGASPDVSNIKPNVNANLKASGESSLTKV